MSAPLPPAAAAAVSRGAPSATAPAVSRVSHTAAPLPPGGAAPAAAPAPAIPVASHTAASGAPRGIRKTRFTSSTKASTIKSTKYVDRKTIKSEKNELIKKLGITLTHDQNNALDEFMNKVLIEKPTTDRSDSKELRIKTEKDKTKHRGFTELDPKKFIDYIDNTPGIAELDLESPSNLIGNAKRIATDREWQQKILEEYELIKKDMNMPDIYDFSR